MKNKGFTLVELMVTVVIMMIMTGVVIFNYSKFNDSSVINQIAYDLSLTIRQAQVYGMAAMEGGGGQGALIKTDNYHTNFQGAYGLHFDIENNPSQFVLFIDSDQDGQYDNGEVPLQTYSFQRGITISNLCYAGAVPANNCGSGKTANKWLDITFLRPDPSAIIKANNLAANKTPSSAIIFLQTSGASPVTKSVVVYSTGQISVQ